MDFPVASLLQKERVFFCGRDVMFLKRLERRKSGKQHTYWVLVESYRTEKGSRHRVVAYLGELKKSERNGRAELCRRLDKKDRPQPSLFDLPRYDDPDDNEPVLVKLKDIQLDRLRDFGDVWLALGLWRLLKLDELLSGCMPSGNEEVPWPTTWTCNTRWSDWAALSEGCYLLRTNLTDTDPATLWKRYTQLTEAEWAFRIHKDELEIRPIWHQKEERVLAHILVCFLAYVLWKALAQWMKAGGLGEAPRTLMEEFHKIKSGDVVLLARTADGKEHPIRLRCVTTPDKAQKVLLHRLGLTLPQRLRRIDEIVQM